MIGKCNRVVQLCSGQQYWATKTAKIAQFISRYDETLQEIIAQRHRICVSSLSFPHEREEPHALQRLALIGTEDAAKVIKDLFYQVPATMI